MRIYLAAPWTRRVEARRVRDELEAAGHTVNSRWLDLHGGGGEHVLATEAQNDIDDLIACDVLVLLNLEKSEGKAVETGFALALDIPIYVIGGHSNVFHYHPRVKHVVLDDLLRAPTR